MKRLNQQPLDMNQILDCSQPDQVNFWADVFNVSPQAIKTAVRACCNNSIACISNYLKNKNANQQAKQQIDHKTPLVFKN